MNPQEEYRDIHKELLRLLAEVETRLSARAPTDKYAQFPLSFVRRAARPMEAMRVLTDRGIWEAVAIITRVLFEMQLKFVLFADSFTKDPDMICHRLVDASVLEIRKQMIQAQGVLPDTPKRKQQLQRLRDMKEMISERYSDAELKAIAQYGFLVLSVDPIGSTTIRSKSITFKPQPRR